MYAALMTDGWGCIYYIGILSMDLACDYPGAYSRSLGDLLLRI